jgi:hypothetical protein
MDLMPACVTRISRFQRGSSPRDRASMRQLGSAMKLDGSRGERRHGRSAIAVLALLGGCGRIDFGSTGSDAAGDIDAHHGNPTDPCALPYQMAGNSCYRVSTNFMPWPMAEADCENDGAHLATIIDVAEHFTLHDLSSNAAVTEIWIGYTDRATQGTFRWVSAGGLDPSTNVCFFGPNGPGNTAGAHCVVQESVSACGDWFVRNCALSRPYICERDGNKGDPASY